MIENALEELPDTSRSIDLSAKGLTAVYHLDHMMHLQSINLSNNLVTSIPDIHYLQCVQNLNVTQNALLLSQEDKNLLKSLKES